MGPDYRLLVTQARKMAQQYYLMYHEPIPTAQLVQRVATVMQEYTQSGGVRPFGVSLLICGWEDDRPYLFQCDPSGAYFAAVPPPWILSVIVNNVTCDSTKCAYNLDVKGDFDDWSLTFAPAESGLCLPDFYVGKNGIIDVPVSEKRLFFCAKSAGEWTHQGGRLYLDAGDVSARSAEW
ncbi:Proteasome subunit alpha type [Operophtera brumata]|uniref:Proteasome subunit alpha type n=1 Tax=Operophtera brumata TaxID=104452 RepID=A0A0L7LIQ3_OPEBR|nr:Proteasome subunit alpha type [Operophtera brumata]